MKRETANGRTGEGANKRGEFCFACSCAIEKGLRRSLMFRDRDRKNGSAQDERNHTPVSADMPLLTELGTSSFTSIRPLVPRFTQMTQIFLPRSLSLHPPNA
jgi:hypothetical protein